MNAFELNRRQALIAAGMGAVSLGMPGLVMGSDQVDANGKAVAAEKSCIFVLLCGGPSHVDTWDMKPDAPDEIRGPYRPIATKVPGMRIAQTSGQPGSTPEIMMRGPTSIIASGRNTRPLIIVDGAILNIGSLDELGGLDIESAG